MADALPSIVQFSEEIATQEPPEPLPIGEYPATVRSCSVKRSQRNTLYGQVDYFIDPRVYPADFTDGNPDGQMISYRRLSLEDNPGARFGVKKFWEKHNLRPPGRQVDVNELVGATVKVKIDHEEYEEVKRAVITAVNPA